MTFATRFAPSPTGRLHLGHAYSALTLMAEAERLGARVLLRIEDTDTTRCRPEFTQAILEDLAWIGFEWSGPPRRQSEHFADYDAALDELASRGLLYPCSCSRQDIARAGAEPGWDGLVYPGTCRGRPMSSARLGDAWRLDLRKAWDELGDDLSLTETGPLHPGTHAVTAKDTLAQIGDPVLRRKGSGDPAYHIACTHDDTAQGITHVIRGADIYSQTWLHVVLQRLMGWPTPLYHHHDLIRDDQGKRLAKIDNSTSLRALREAGATPRDIRAMIGL